MWFGSLNLFIPPCIHMLMFQRRQINLRPSVRDNSPRTLGPSRETQTPGPLVITHPSPTVFSSCPCSHGDGNGDGNGDAKQNRIAARVGRQGTFLRPLPHLCRAQGRHVRPCATALSPPPHQMYISLLPDVCCIRILYGSTIHSYRCTHIGGLIMLFLKHL